MPKRRKVQGQEKEIMHFYIANFSQAAAQNEYLISDLKNSLLEYGIHILEFSTASGRLAIINESSEIDYKLTLPEIYALFDSFDLESKYSGSEKV